MSWVKKNAEFVSRYNKDPKAAAEFVVMSEPSLFGRPGIRVVAVKHVETGYFSVSAVSALEDAYRAITDAERRRLPEDDSVLSDLKAVRDKSLYGIQVAEEQIGRLGSIIEYLEGRL